MWLGERVGNINTIEACRRHQHPTFPYLAISLVFQIAIRPPSHFAILPFRHHIYIAMSFFIPLCATSYFFLFRQSTIFQF